MKIYLLFFFTCRDSSFKIGQLEEEVRSKNVECEALDAKLSVATSSLALSQERISKLEKYVAELQEQLTTTQDTLIKQDTVHKQVIVLFFNTSKVFLLIINIAKNKMAVFL